MSEGILSVRKLRWLMVTGAVALVAVLAGYIGYARYLRSKLKVDFRHLGDKLHIDTEGVTFSSTEQGITKFTVHAARRLDMKDGKVELYDVGIILYGPNGDRSDHIHGNEFEYDPKQEVMTGVGDVYIDLAPPKPSAGKTVKGDLESRTVHLKTSGLIFRQKEQVARTDNPLEFRVAGMNGTAVGASYDSANGIIVMEHNVKVSGLRRRGTSGMLDRPMALTANHAEIDMEDGPQAGNVAFLDGASLVEATENGTETASARLAVVHMSSDGTPKHVDGTGDVTLTGEGRGTVNADKMSLDLNQAGQPSAAHLMGAVRYADETAAKKEHGKADDARIAFDEQGRPVHALMTGSVEAVLAAGTSSRVLHADKLDLALAGGGKEPVVVRTAEATSAGGAKMQLVDTVATKAAQGKPGSGVATTNVRADVLDAQFLQKGRRSELAGVDGHAHTFVERTLTDAASGGTVWTESGTGDLLRLDFAEDATGRDAIRRAEQHGNVKVVREAKSVAKNAKPGAVDVEHAEADDAIYEAAGDRMTMTTGVKVTDSQSALYADRVVFERGSGDATADGGVRVSYLQDGGTGEPMHVIAARAVGHKASGTTNFYAAPGGNARMWQGGSSVEAPVLDFDRTRKTVVAHGTDAANAAVVKTVLVDDKAKASATGGATQQGGNAPVRVWSRELTYTDAMRQAIFRGLVHLEDQDVVMRSQEATVFLAAKDAAASAARPGFAGSGSGGAMDLGGKVDHIVATDGVEIEEPGRRATGDRLVYTQADQTSVLTGTRATPPRLVDQAQGTVTGAALRFRKGDDSVEVLSGDGAQRVHSETHMKQRD